MEKQYSAHGERQEGSKEGGKEGRKEAMLSLLSLANKLFEQQQQLPKADGSYWLLTGANLHSPSMHPPASRGGHVAKG